MSDLFEVGSGTASPVGVIVPEDARVAGKVIKDIDIPRECVAAAVIRPRPCSARWSQSRAG